eukprot:9707026-Karenia_brevis.AAC.1
MAFTGSKFSLGAATKASTKRQAESLLDRTGKAPKASDCDLQEITKPQRTAQRLPEDAPVVLCIYKYTDEAADVWSAYEGKEGVQLWQVQMQHDARPGITYGIIDDMNSLLREKHAQDDSIPASLRELQDKGGIKLVLTDRTDPDEVGYVPYRLAFYVAGGQNALSNVLYLLDELFVKKAARTARETPFAVHLHPHSGVDIAHVWDDLEYGAYTMHDPAPELALGVFEAQPVAGKRIVKLHLQPESAEIMSILVMGQIWNYRTRLDSHGVPGAWYGSEENRSYVRILKSIDVSEESQQQKVLDMLGDSVFKDLAIRAVVDSPPEEDSDVAMFIARLEKTNSLHF